MSKIMSSIQLTANRRNARQSTGPKSAAGQKLPRLADDGAFRPGLNRKITKRTQMQTLIFPNKSGPIPCVEPPVG